MIRCEMCMMSSLYCGNSVSLCCQQHVSNSVPHINDTLLCRSCLRMPLVTTTEHGSTLQTSLTATVSRCLMIFLKPSTVPFNASEKPPWNEQFSILCTHPFIYLRCSCTVGQTSLLREISIWQPCKFFLVGSCRRPSWTRDLCAIIDWLNKVWMCRLSWRQY